MSKCSGKAAWVMAAMLGLAGCSTVEVRPAGQGSAVVTEQALADEAARQQQVRAQVDWDFQGRAAISKGKDGGNGRLTWQQRGAQYRVELSAPVTRQSWVLTGDRTHAALAGLAGGTREGADAGALLHAATGWDIPVPLLVEWVRGLPVGGVADDGALSRDEYGRPRSLQQAGWSIQYIDWFAADGVRPSLPKRIEAVNGDAKVRLIIDQWEAAQP